jgi:hypothetical protein
VEISINALVERLDDFIFEKASLTWRYVAGLSTELPLSQLHKQFAELSRRDSFLHVREVATNARTDEERKRGLKLLLAFLGERFEEQAASAALEEIASIEAKAQVSAGNLTLPLHSALSRIAEEPSRERRSALENATGEMLWEKQAAWARRVDAGMAAASELGFPSYQAAQEELTGVSLDKLAADAAQMLAKTADAWDDLLGYALKKIDGDLKRESARLHDVMRAAAVPWLFEHFRKEDVMPAATRCLNELGLDPNQGGRISFDSELREGKRTGARVLVFRVPDDVRLVTTPRGGIDGMAEVMHAFGRAQHCAMVARTTHLLDRRLGDGAVPGSMAMLLENLMTDPAWHKRYLRLPAASAKEAARLFAFRQLFKLRWRAAMVSQGIALYARGPVRPLAGEYEDAMQGALHAPAPKGRYLYDIEPGWKGVESLRAAALEAHLHATLRERFNEDFWRNPSTGRWLAGFSAHGQRDNADQVAQATGASGLSLTQAGARLVAVMGS